MGWVNWHSRDAARRMALRWAAPAALVAILSALGPGAALAQQSPIGSSVKVQNTVTGAVGGKTVDLTDGSEVFANELVKTEAASLARLTFLDDTNLSLGPSSQVQLDRCVFDANRSASSV